MMQKQGRFRKSFPVQQGLVCFNNHVQYIVFVLYLFLMHTIIDDKFNVLLYECEILS